MNRRVALALTGTLALIVGAMPACTRDPAGPGPAGDHGHEHGPGEDHGHEAGHGGEVIALGTASIGAFRAVATRDEGQVVAGGEAAVDVTITPGEGSSARAVAVRLWIGIEDATGSVKALASVEDQDEPSRWHTHVEVPSPMPEGTRLWIEIESSDGQTAIGSVELKA